jgi:hypothetical protein
LGRSRRWRIRIGQEQVMEDKVWEGADDGG